MAGQTRVWQDTNSGRTHKDLSELYRIHRTNGLSDYEYGLELGKELTRLLEIDLKERQEMYNKNLEYQNGYSSLLQRYNDGYISLEEFEDELRELEFYWEQQRCFEFIEQNPEVSSQKKLDNPEDWKEAAE